MDTSTVTLWSTWVDGQEQITKYYNLAEMDAQILYHALSASTSPNVFQVELWRDNVCVAQMHR